MFKNFRLKGTIDMEKMDDGILSNKLQCLHEVAKEMENDIAVIDNDKTLLNRRKGLEDYKFALSNYMSHYGQIAEHLEQYADVRKLLNFIAEWAIFDPDILIGLAENLKLMQAWHNVPERSVRKRRR